jgi:transcriptional regulator of NAD metabolism
MEDILTISESKNTEIISMHTSYIRKYESSKKNISDSRSGITRKMGYISSVSEAKKILEKLYNNS